MTPFLRWSMITPSIQPWIHLHHQLMKVMCLLNWENRLRNKPKRSGWVSQILSRQPDTVCFVKYSLSCFKKNRIVHIWVWKWWKSVYKRFPPGLSDASNTIKAPRLFFATCPNQLFLQVQTLETLFWNSFQLSKRSFCLIWHPVYDEISDVSSFGDWFVLGVVLDFSTVATHFCILTSRCWRIPSLIWLLVH